MVKEVYVMCHNPNIMHVKRVILRIQDIKKSLVFYQDILGLTVVDQINNITSLGTTNKNVLIELVEEPDAIPMGITQGLYHYALLLPSRKDLAHVIQRLINKKYPISGASDHGVSEAIYLNDPDGHGIEIYRDRMPSEWPKVNDQITMFTEAMDIEGVMSLIDPTVSYQFPEGTIMGHLHLHVKSLEQASQFFIDTLGFQIVLAYGSSALFISDQGYHHHIGLNTWQRNAPYVKEHQIGLISYVISLSNEKFNEIKGKTDAITYDNDMPMMIDPLGQRINFEIH
jgi:catechol 2,3-dioxygenase